MLEEIREKLEAEIGQLVHELNVILPHRIIQGHWCRLGAASLSWAEGSASGVAISLVCIVSKEGLLFHPVLLGSLSSAQVFELAGS